VAALRVASATAIRVEPDSDGKLPDWCGEDVTKSYRTALVK